MIHYAPVVGNKLYTLLMGSVEVMPMFLNGEDIDVMIITSSNDMLDLMPDTSISLMDFVGDSPNVVCGDIKSLVSVWWSKARSGFETWLRTAPLYTMFRHIRITLSILCLLGRILVCC